VLQCVVEYVAACCIVLQGAAVFVLFMDMTQSYCLQCASSTKLVCCSVLQHVAAVAKCCNALQHTFVLEMRFLEKAGALQSVAA